MILPTRLSDGIARRFDIEEAALRAILEQHRTGTLNEDEVVSRLRDLPYRDLDFAKVDRHRALRQGFPEVVFGQGKTPGQIASISASVLDGSERLLVTRATADAFAATKRLVADAEYDETARCIVVDRRADRRGVPGVAVLCAGTADLPVATEAAIAAELIGCEVDRISDVGVAGLHRLLDHLPRLRRCRALVVAAGMEGALPSVVGGLVDTPIIAVPTSVGYGASFGGLAALLAMLNGCAPGVAVVNIDNGFGAGYMAAMINLSSQDALTKVEDKP